MKTVTRNEDRDEEQEGLCFDVVGPIDLGQLDDQIVKAHKWRKSAGLVMDTVDWDNDPETNTVWVTHENADEKTVAKVMKAHRPVEPSNDPQDLIDRVRDGESLDPEQVQSLLVHLLDQGGVQAKA